MRTMRSNLLKGAALGFSLLAVLATTGRRSGLQTEMPHPTRSSAVRRETRRCQPNWSSKCRRAEFIAPMIGSSSRRKIRIS